MRELAGGAFRPAIPIQIGIGIDQVTLGGSNVANLRGDISTDADGWNLNSFEFRAPGFTQVKLSGHLAVTATASASPGRPRSRPAIRRCWPPGWKGGGEAAQGDLRPLRLRGDVTLGSDKLAIERLNADFDRKTVAGRLLYVFAAGNRARPSSMPRSTRPNSTSTPRSASARRCLPAPPSSGRAT